MAYDIHELVVTNDETNKRIQDGIEKNRKGDFTLKTPFKPGEKVHVKLKNHKFRFGCNMFMLDEIPDDKHKNELYKEKLAALFNMATGTPPSRRKGIRDTIKIPKKFIAVRPPICAWNFAKSTVSSRANTRFVTIISSLHGSRERATKK